MDYPKNNVDAGGNFISGRIQGILQKKVNIEPAVSSSSYHHYSNGQVEACIKFLK